MFDSIIFIFRTVNITFGKTVCKHNKIDQRFFNIRKVTVGRLEQFIKKLPEEQQEICNALNRRTEFRVLRTTYGLFDIPDTPKNNTEAKEQDSATPQE